MTRSVCIRKDVPFCCREQILRWEAINPYGHSINEPGDLLQCPLCGNALVYDPPGWRVRSGSTTK